MKILGIIKTLVVLGIAVFGINFVWHFFTDAPSTTSICYAWSKATDSSLAFQEYGIDGSQWLEDNIKSEKDLENLDSDVLSAMRLYDEGQVFDEVDPDQRLGLRDAVIEACEKVSPGSTEHEG